MTQNWAEKLLNDYLFATSKDMDKLGRDPNGSEISNLLAMPELKIGGLVTLPLSIIFASAGSIAPAIANLAIYTIALSASPMIAGEARRQAKEGESFGNDLVYLFKPHLRWLLKGAASKEYYFDTAPSIKLPVPEDLKPVLERDKFLAQATGILSVIPPLLMPTMSALYFPSLLMETASVAAVMIASKTSYFVAASWRIDQALKGNWNVTTQRPEKSPEPVMAHAPAPSQG